MIQLFIIYNLVLLFQSSHLYYSLLYLFSEIILFGFVLFLYQLDLFAGFLWIAEGTIILVFILLLMYLNSDGLLKNQTIQLRYKILACLITTLAFIVVLNYNVIEVPSYFITDYVVLWDDLYESIYHNVTHDFSILFISYYNINSMEFIIFALLLFFGTLVCVALFKGFYSIRLLNYSNFFSLFDFFYNKVGYNFLRQQNLHKQSMSVPTNRIIKKK